MKFSRDICGPKRTNITDFDQVHIFPLAPPAGWHMWLRAQYLDNNLMNFREIYDRFSKSPEDSFKQLCWSVTFFSGANIYYMDQNKCGTDNHGAQTIYSASFGDPLTFQFLLESLYNGKPSNNRLEFWSTHGPQRTDCNNFDPPHRSCSVTPSSCQSCLWTTACKASDIFISSAMTAMWNINMFALSLRAL